MDMEKDIEMLTQPGVEAARRHSIASKSGGLRRKSSILLRDDLVRRQSTLGSQHAGHSTWQSASGHLVTAIIGAGVLGLPFCISWLGWVGGIISLVGFYVITLWTMRMLAAVYEVKGRRATRYKIAVMFILGARASLVLSVFQHVTMVLISVGYHIAAADSMAFIGGEICKTTGVAPAACYNQMWLMAIIFACVQLMMSQLPNLESAWWASIIGAIMSIGYSAIAIILGAMEAHNGLGSIAGHPGTPLQKTMGVFNALGTISASYSCAIVLIEIQDTIREPPKAEVSMNKALNAGLSLTFILYMAVSVLDYLALGDSAPGNVLLGFHHAPAWLNMMANFFVLIHMVSAYQVFAQPVFATIEDTLLGCIPKLADVKEAIVRAVYRSLYVAFTTVIASALPFFSAFIGLVGAISYLPSSVVFPILMYKAVYSPGKTQVLLMNFVMVVMTVVSFMAIVGSVFNIIGSASTMKPFQGSGGHGR